MLESLETNDKKHKFISISEKGYPLNKELINFEIPELRNKHSRIESLIKLPIFIKNFLSIMTIINKTYNVKIIISTGPGIIIPISLYFKFKKNIQIVFLETWSRFETKSFTGRFMYKIADKFYIQNKSLKKLYPNSIYGGLL